MIVGICKLDITLDGHRSLKQKRQVLRKIKDSVFSRFKIPVAEVGYNELWQRSELGFAIVGNSKDKINSIMDKIIDYVFDECGGYIINKTCEYVYLKE